MPRECLIARNMAARTKLLTSTATPGVLKWFSADHALPSQSATLFGGTSLLYWIFCLREQTCDIASMKDLEL